MSSRNGHIMVSETLTHARSRWVERGSTVSLHKLWNHSGLFAVLAVAAILNFYELGGGGYGNSYYAAAVRSMAESWHAFLFNALDPAGFVSIDKPPLGFWLQVGSVKLFGFSGPALMLPQALAGVASVALLYVLVRRVFGTPAGLLAALALALTPISVVANRSNIVDSTLVLVLLLAAWAVSRATETGKLRWLLLGAVLVGLGFNIKMLEAYLVVPALGVVYLLGAPSGWWRRLLHLGLAGVVLLGISLAWVTAVDLTPASQRPWVGSTTDNSELSLAIGYNGLQRLTGNSSVGGRGGAPSAAARTSAGNGGGPINGGPGGVGENGPTGPLRLLDTQLAGQTGWLLPLAVIGFIAGAWYTRRRLPLDARQSALLLWGAWLLTTGVFFSIAGFYHTYYLVMVAPAIAALTGIGLTALWQMYRPPGSRLWFLLPLGLLAVAAVQVHILGDYPSWSRWLSPLIAGLALLGALILTLLRLRPRLGARLAIPALLLGVAALLAGPAVWSVESVNAADAGLLPRAGPSGSLGSSGPGGFAPAGLFRPPSGNLGPPAGGTFAPPRGGGFQPPSGNAGPNGGGGPGGMDQVNTGLLRYLVQHQGTATYLFATTGAGTAEPYIIATGKPVMAMGGFTGSDPILTPAKLAALVKQGAVRYFLLGGGGGFGGPRGDSNSATTSWIQAHCTVVPASKYSSSGSQAGGTLYYCGAAT